MGFLACQGLDSEVVSMAQTGQRIGRWRQRCIFAEDSLQALNDEIFDDGASPCSGDLGPFQDGVWQINRGLHLWP
jgi:hypothetical protein